jgi:hypothetical protein
MSFQQLEMVLEIYLLEVLVPVDLIYLLEVLVPLDLIYLLEELVY